MTFFGSKCRSFLGPALTYALLTLGVFADCLMSAIIVSSEEMSLLYGTPLDILLGCVEEEGKVEERCSTSQR